MTRGSKTGSWSRIANKLRARALRSRKSQGQRSEGHRGNAKHKTPNIAAARHGEPLRASPQECSSRGCVPKESPKSREQSARDLDFVMARCGLNEELDQHCVMCDGKGILTCGGCKTAKYCSAGCQWKDSSIHHMLCMTYRPFAADPVKDGPGFPALEDVETTRAVLFPSLSAQPIFTYVTVRTDSMEISYKDPDYAGKRRKISLAGKGGKVIIINTCETSRYIGHGLMLVTPDDFHVRKRVTLLTRTRRLSVYKASLNRSIARLTGPRGFRRPFYGAVLLIAFTLVPDAGRPAGSKFSTRPVNFRDFRFAVDFLQLQRADPRERFMSSQQIRSIYDWQHGVAAFYGPRPGRP